MKRNLLLFAAVAAAISLAVSCNKQELNSPVDGTMPEPVPTESYVSLTFRAEYPAPLAESKTTIADDGTVSWKAGDVITLYYLENGSPASTPATAISDGRSTEFTTTLPQGIDAFYAAYPAGTGEIDVNGVFKLKTNLTQNGSFEQANFAAAWAKVSEDMVLKFKNAVGLFKVQLPAGGVISHNGVDHVLRSLTIAGKGGATPRWGDLTVTADESGEISFSEPENTNGSIYIKLDGTTRTQGYVYLHSLPFSSDEGIVIRYRDENEVFLPAVVTKDGKAVTLERGHIKPVNASYDAIVWDWYFSPDGTGDGKSESAPAGLETFQTLLNGTSLRHVQWQLNEATLHLADGTYTLTEQLKIQGTQEGHFTIEGASREGTLIDGTTLGANNLQMLPYTSKMNLTLNHLTFQNGTSKSNGGAVNTGADSGYLTCNDCGFVNNKTTSAGNSGAIYYGGKQGIQFKNCFFNGNTSPTKVGGAVSLGGSAEGTVQFQGCTFSENKTGTEATSGTGCNGGAIYAAHPGKVLIDDCVFLDNQAWARGGAVCVAQASAVVYITRSLFRGNTIRVSGYADNGAAIYVTNGVAAVYNGSFSYNHSSSSSSATSVFSGGKYIVANSTFVESMKVSHGVICNKATADHHSTIVNSIAITTSTTETHPALSVSAKADYNHVDCGYNLVTRIQEAFTVAAADNTTVTPVTKATFGIGDYDLATKGFIWNGDLSAVPNYSKCTLSQVEALIKANTITGEDFWNYLESTTTEDGYKLSEVDVRGVKRNTLAPIWPGSYQKD